MPRQAPRSVQGLLGVLCLLFPLPLPFVLSLSKKINLKKILQEHLG